MAEPAPAPTRSRRTLEDASDASTPQLKPSAVVAALRCLPVRRARVLVLRYSAMTEAEIASVIGP